MLKHQIAENKPFTELDPKGYSNTTAAHSAAKREVKRLIPSRDEPKVEKDYRLSKETIDGEERYLVVLMGDALYALKDQPITFVLQMKTGNGTIGYLTEDDLLVWPEFREYAKSIPNYRLVTMQCRQTLIGFVNKGMKPGYKWVPLYQWIHDTSDFMEKFEVDNPL